MFWAEDVVAGVIFGRLVFGDAVVKPLANCLAHTGEGNSLLPDTAPLRRAGVVYHPNTATQCFQVVPRNMHTWAKPFQGSYLAQKF